MVNLVFAGDSIASAYEARIIAAGGTISFTHLAAIRAFIATGKLEGWWDKILDCCPFLGSNLAAGLCKLVVAPGTPSSYQIVNEAPEADYISYTLDRGIVIEGNPGMPTGQHMLTGVIPVDHGLSNTNISYGAGTVLTDDMPGAGFSGQCWFCYYETDVFTDGPDHGGLPLSSFGFGGFGWNRSYNAACSTGPDGYQTGAIDGIGTIDGTGPSPTGRLDLEFEFFRARKFGTEVATADGSVAFCFIGSWLTASETRGITAAARQMHVSARQIVVGTHDVFIGDSITVGQGSTGGAWSERVMNARRLIEPHYAATNVAQSGIATSYSDFPVRYTGTGAYPVTIYFTKMGANDCSTGANVVAYKQALLDMANTLKALNTLTVVVTISFQDFVGSDPVTWTEATAHAHMMQYVTAALEAADEAGVLGVDAYTPMLADPDPATTYLVDFVHLNSTGAQFVADLVLDAYAAYRASL